MNDFEGFQLCACLGKQYNEPECPCVMNRLNLPPSQERLDHLAYLDSPEGKEEQRIQWENLKAMFSEITV